MRHFVHMQIANYLFFKKINYDTRDVFVTRYIAIVHGILKQKKSVTVIYAVSWLIISFQQNLKYTYL